jgi:membrane-associated phospholipid phosphatase
MDQNRPSIPEVLTYLGGLGFVIGTVTMAAFPFAVAALVFGLLLLPLLVPVLLLGLLYGVLVALPRRYLAARRSRRPAPSSEPSKNLVTRSSYS